MTERRGWFVTGTDTGAGMKPVAAGCAATAEGLRNDDAVRLQRQSSLRLDYARVNPVALPAPVAPHIAARQAGVSISIGVLRRAFDALAMQVDCVVVEGVGGWQVPLTERETVADLAVALGLDVVLVVGVRLGCLNHALLSAESIARSGLVLAGWVANCLPPLADAVDENIIALKTRISAPLLGIVPALAAPDVKTVACTLRVPAG